MAIHVCNLEKYNPGYRDRHLIWMKAYFSMVNADPDFEMLDEIDKWRFLVFCMQELQLKKPVPEGGDYWVRRGFNLKRRPLNKTINALIGSKVVELVGTTHVTENPQVRNGSVTQNRIEENRIEKNTMSGKPDDADIPFDEIIRHLNQIADKNYQDSSAATRRFITARWNDGYRLPDFIYVNSIKAEEWRGTDHEKYLRPETLYGTKFEGYRNQKRGKSVPPKTAGMVRAAQEYLTKDQDGKAGPGEISGGNQPDVIDAPKES